MDITAYSRNLRGVNDNADFSPEYLVSLLVHLESR
jgi:Sec7-like guanine-nucleotide exchange factor